jgi:ribose transport system substrate-binding protein
MKSLNNQFFIDMRDGAVKYQQQKQTFNLLTAGIQTETDIDGQASLVEDYIKRKVDAIVIAPADSYGLVPELAKAVKAGIKVINIDVKLDASAMKDAGFDSVYVGPDNAAGAKLAGDALAKALGSGGKVVILEGNPGADNATQRKNGFMAAVKEGGLQLLDNKSAHWETEEAKTVFTNMLAANPDVEGVMCSNDAMVLGVAKVLEATGKTGKIKVVGFDNIPDVQPLIKQNKVLATVDQFGSQQAIYGIDNALKLLAGQQVTGWIKTPVKLITLNELGS